MLGTCPVTACRRNLSVSRPNRGLHGDIHVQATSVEIVFSFRDRLLCRLAPYRELFHVQVGGNPGWETRVRSETGFLDTVDRTLERFLDIYGAAPG